MDNNAWPEFEPENKFDWSLSLQQIDRKYGSAPLKPPVFKIKASKRRTVYVTKQDSKRKYTDSRGFEKHFATKYPYIHGLLTGANPDLPRWLYDNLIKNSSEQ